MLKRVRDHCAARQTFAFETTLAGRGYARFLTDARTRGYRIHLIYIWLASVGLALSRVAERVRQGGHDVPPDVVRRRYHRSVRNFFALYQPLADTWMLCDNSGDDPCVVARGAKGEVPLVLDRERFNLVQKMADDGP